MLSGMSPGGLLSTAAGCCDGAAAADELGCGLGAPVEGALLVGGAPERPAAAGALP